MMENGKNIKVKNILSDIAKILPLAAAPFLIMLILSMITGKNLYLSVPTLSDEIDYFREMYSFSQVGFNFGGSLYAGYEATAGPLGAHSFSPIVAWGIPALIFNWNEHSILIINLCLLSLAWIIFYINCRPQKAEYFLVLGLAFLYAPLIMYVFTSTIEVPVYAGLIVYSSLFIKYGRNRKKSTMIWMFAVGALTFFMRVTYIVILFPAIWAVTDYEINKKTVRNMIIYVVAFLAAYKIYNIFCAGYPVWVTEKISNAQGFIGKLKVIAGNTLVNKDLFFTFKAERSQTSVRFAYLIIVILLGTASFVHHFDRKKFSLFFMTGGLWVIMMTLYDIKDFRDFRMFAPIIFMVLLIETADNASGGRTGITDDNHGKEPASKFIENHGILKLAMMVLFAVVFFACDKTMLTEDRAITQTVETDTAFSDLATVRSDGTPKVLAVTMDINSVNVELAKSVPAQLGYKFFYCDWDHDITIDMLDDIDYMLTDQVFIDYRPDIMEHLSYIKETSYGYLYEVKKRR